MVIGYHHPESGSPGSGDPFDAGNTVIHCYQYIRLALQRHRDNFRSQAVTVLEAIGHQIIHPRGAQRAQTHYRHRAGRGAVTIEVTDNQDRLALLQRLTQYRHRLLHALEQMPRQQGLEAALQFICAAHTPGRIQAGQQWRQVAQIR